MSAAPIVAVVALVFGIFASLSVWHLATLVQKLMLRIDDLEAVRDEFRGRHYAQRKELEEMAAAAGFRRASLAVQPTWERKP